MNVERLLGSLLNGGMGGGRRRSKKSSMLGAMGVGKAQVGLGLLGVAFAAFEHYQQSNPPAQAQALGAMPPAPPNPPPRVGGPPPPPPPSSALRERQADANAQRESDLLLVLEVMIAAAHADGHLDNEERSRILERAMQLDLGADDRKRLLAILEQPPGIAEIASRARAQIAPDLYAAAFVAISVDTDAERLWLQSLADALRLDAASRQNIELTLSN